MSAPSASPSAFTGFGSGDGFTLTFASLWRIPSDGIAGLLAVVGQAHSMSAWAVSAIESRLVAGDSGVV